MGLIGREATLIFDDLLDIPDGKFNNPTAEIPAEVLRTFWTCVILKSRVVCFKHKFLLLHIPFEGNLDF